VTSEYRKDHAENPCTICKSPPGVSCEHDEPMPKPTSTRIIIGVDVNDEYRLLVGDGSRASEAEVTDYLNALVQKDKERLIASKSWACPKCHVTADGHSQSEACPSGCVGFLCECPTEADSETHGTPDDPCPTARCWHCSWTGTFPKKVVPKELKGWSKTAWNAGWRPPHGWTPDSK